MKIRVSESNISIDIIGKSISINDFYKIIKTKKELCEIASFSPHKKIFNGPNGQYAIGFVTRD